MLPIVIILLFFLLFAKRGTKAVFPYVFAFFLMSIKIPVAGPCDVGTILLWMTALFCIKKKRQSKYPFLGCTIVIIMSYLISSLVAVGNPHWVLSFCELTKMLLLPYLFFVIVQEEKELQSIYRILLATVYFASFVLLIEFIFGVNLWQLLMKSLLGSYGWDMDGKMRYGVNRLQSIYLHSTSLGYIYVTIFSFIILFIYNKNFVSKKTINTGALVLLCLGVFLSGSRSSIIPLCVCLLLYFRKKMFKLNFIIVSVFLLIIFAYIGGSYFYDIFASIADSSYEHGSSSQMREAQLGITMKYFAQRPIFGWGNGSIFDIIQDRMGEKILGAESVWFPLLVNFGIVGCIAHVYIYVSCYKAFTTKMSGLLIFLILQLVVKSLTSTPGFDMGIVMCLVLFLLKMRSFSSCGDRLS